MAWQRTRARRIHGMATALRQRGFVCTRWAVVRVQEGAIQCAPYVNPARTRAAAWPCFAAGGLCRTDASDGVRRGGAPRWPRRRRAPAAAKRAGRSIGRWLGGECQVGGSGCGAHLDRGDLRYQRKQARVVRRAGHVVVHAVGAVDGHECVLLLPAALVQAEVGVPVGIAAQVPPVALPAGAVLGVGLVPVGPRGHTEPAGVAVPVLPSVRPAMLISEHAAAEDADAVEGVPSPYDRRHAAAVSLVFDCPRDYSLPPTHAQQPTKTHPHARYPHARTHARTHALLGL